MPPQDLNSWSSDGGTVWGRVRTCNLAEGSVSADGVLESESLLLHLAPSLRFTLAVEDASSQLPALDTRPASLPPPP